MAEKQDSQAWRTQHELAFIDGLGLYSDNHGMNRKELLEGYAKGVQARSDWGEVSKIVVVVRVNKLLVELAFPKVVALF